LTNFWELSSLWAFWSGWVCEVGDKGWIFSSI
jgi:hypothetical protein